MEAKFQIFLILLAVLAGASLLARRVNVAPAILLLLTGVVLAFVPGMPTLELPPHPRPRRTLRRFRPAWEPATRMSSSPISRSGRP